MPLRSSLNDSVDAAQVGHPREVAVALARAARPAEVVNEELVRRCNRVLTMALLTMAILTVATLTVALLTMALPPIALLTVAALTVALLTMRRLVGYVIIRDLSLRVEAHGADKGLVFLGQSLGHVRLPRQSARRVGGWVA